MELAGLEPATSWVRCGMAQRIECADLLTILAFPGGFTARSRGSVCRGLSGLWSALAVARTSDGAALVTAPSSSEPGRSEEVNLKG
jgi:hypothetical protein